MSDSLILSRLNAVKTYCDNNDFCGWDPFDGLNSPVIQKTPLGRSRSIRLAWIQLFKLNLINLRPLFRIKKGENAKGLGLFLTGYCNLYTAKQDPELLQTIRNLADRLLDGKTHGFSGDCWGYNFDWQNRAFFLKAGTPTVVATSFVARALMDAYDVTGEERYLTSALSSCSFITKDLYRSNIDGGCIFSYSPFDQTQVFNASLLGSYLLARASTYDSRDDWRELSLLSAKVCAGHQREDGAWIYGKLGVQNWVDSFHTGYNLECLSEIDRLTGNNEFVDSIDCGAKFYFDHFFLADGTPKYYDTRVYPIDIHSPAQLSVTVSRLQLFEAKKSLVEKVLKWTAQNMWNTRGFFDYRVNRHFRNTIPYMRWSQAWMFYGMSFYVLESHAESS